MMYSVLTYIFNDYEIVREILEPDENAEYILVTDNPNLRSSTWKIVLDEKLSEFSVFDKCYYVRYHPFEYVHTEICIRVDGSILIKSPLSPIIERFNKKKADLAIMLNPVFNYLHEDYEYWINNRNYPRRCAEKCLTKLYELGYNPEYKGYYQACFLVERRTELTKSIDDLTYKLLVELGDDGVIERFDQPIWSFVLNKYFSDKVKVMPVDEYLITFSKYFSWCWHNSIDRIPYKLSSVPPYLFDKITKIEHFDFLHSRGNIKIKIGYIRCRVKSMLKRLLKLA